MTRSGLLETRGHLSQIINRVLHGEEHLILRNNVPVAKIVPIPTAVNNQMRALIKEIKAIRSSAGKITSKDMTQWKKEGRA